METEKNFKMFWFSFDSNERGKRQWKGGNGQRYN